MNRRNLLQMTGVMGAGLALGAGGQTAKPARAAVRPAAIAVHDGTTLFVRESGTGEAVVLVHSWGLASDMWQYQTVALAAAGHRCIAYDRRGHGRSACPAGGYDIDALSDDLAAVIEASGARDITLIGHSMGCAEAVRYLTRHGTGKVKRVALLSPTLPFLLQTPDNPEGIPGAAFEQLRALWRADFPKWIADNAAPFVTPETSPAMTAWLIGLMLQMTLDVAIACNTAMVETDFRPDLKALKLPVLLVHGDRDASAPLELTARRTAALVPQARFEIYEGAPHGLFVTHTERLNADLLRFIRET